MSQAREIGSGPLGRATASVYTLLITGVLLVLVTAPSAVLVLLLDASPGNLPAMAAVLVPVGPAISAAVFALHDADRAEELTPSRAFWRGYRLGVVDALALWVPYLLAVTVIGFTLVNFELAGVPEGYGLVLLVLGVVLTVWVLQALLISALFALRTRDVARLSVYYLARLPLVGLGVLAIVIIAIGIVVLTLEPVLVIAAPVLLWMLVRTSAPVIRDVTSNFTTEGAP